jgi:two-component system chemotaxis response regulator CheY
MSENTFSKMSGNVLVVDDELVTRRVVTLALESTGAKVFAVGDAHTALEVIHTTPIHVALIDINLPDMDGLTLIRELKQIAGTEQLPIIVFTARSRADDQETAFAIGAVGFLYKPFSTQVLRGTVAQYLNIQ